MLFFKDKHNATNIAAMVMSCVEMALFGILFVNLLGGSFISGLSHGISGSSIYQDTKEDSGTLLYNENGVSIYYNGFDTDSLTSIGLKIYAKNESTNNISIECDKLVIDGYKMSDYMHMNVDAGLKENDTIKLYASYLENIDISNIKSIDGTFTITNKDNGDVIDSFDFHIE